MRQIVDCFAEYERAIIRARTCAALPVIRDVIGVHGVITELGGPPSPYVGRV
jgi:hypothetical protein